ncbi:hypothetical protein [Alkalihalobacillus sp. LMS39]|uniref:hypothetical protein n=1 Tax=Alkalihalobacillus sp. LMS39 TaxID=2924032 RepID=UPI001FB1EA8E|nr:hypothetical protein [Alkalihalobacillus sp. LMS39]UOE96035.1 hypothetical protein MM271_10730 [Alkalihalobacillus sp. LMS39]
MSVIVHDLVETKQYFVEETKPNFYVIYDKYENQFAMFQGKDCKTEDIGTEEVVKILHGDDEFSLRQVDSYTVGKEYASIQDILFAVKQTHKEIFI